MNGIGIPVLTPFKFYPASSTTGDGVNFQNIDNTELFSQDWEGIYPKRFIQPVPRYWYDLSPGIDFQVQLDTAVLSFANFKAAVIDLNGVIVKALTTVDFITISGTTKQIRVYMDEVNIDDGCYRIKLYEDGGDDIYYSEIISLADTHEDTYPFDFSNFENAFGMIFTGTSDTWKGKMLIPLRMYKPLPEDEREVYTNDPGEIVTLRSVPKRIYQLESFPVSTWFAEKFKLMFSCSDLTLNKSVVNTEETPEIEIIQETDLIQIVGEVALNEFVDEYLQDDQLDEETELLTSWEADGATVGDWSDFTPSGKNITEANYEEAGIATAFTNNFNVVANTWYKIVFNLGSVEGDGPDLTTVTLTINTTSKAYPITEEENTILYMAPSSTAERIDLTVGEDTLLAAFCSMTVVEKI